MAWCKSFLTKTSLRGKQCQASGPGSTDANHEAKGLIRYVSHLRLRAFLVWTLLLLNGLHWDWQK